MKGHSAAAVGALLVGAAHATASNGVVQWDIQRTQRAQEFTRLRRRGSTFEEVISNEEARGGYFAVCSLGTPAQKLTLQLDTGSSDIWVPDSQATICDKNGGDSENGCDLGSCKSTAPSRAMAPTPYSHNSSSCPVPVDNVQRRWEEQVRYQLRRREWLLGRLLHRRVQHRWCHGAEHDDGVGSPDHHRVRTGRRRLRHQRGDHREHRVAFLAISQLARQHGKGGPDQHGGVQLVAERPR